MRLKIEARRFALIDKLARRHLSVVQKAEAALELMKVFTVGRGRRTDKMASDRTSDKLTDVHARDEAARLTGVAAGTISSMKAVLEYGDKSLLEQVRRGEVKVSAAARFIKESEKPSKMLERQPLAIEGTVFSCLTGTNADLIANVASLYLRHGDRIADVTYGKGVFWSKTDMSQFDFHGSDILAPKTGKIKRMDFCKLKYPDAQFDVAVIDPPYVHDPGGTSLLGHAYKNQHTSNRQCWRHNDILDLYGRGMKECSRILKSSGVLWVKCGDEVESNRLRCGHCEIWEIATKELGLTVQDMFVLQSEHVPVMKIQRQHHARRNNSYLWIFRKG